MDLKNKAMFLRDTTAPLFTATAFKRLSMSSAGTWMIDQFKYWLRAFFECGRFVFA